MECCCYNCGWMIFNPSGATFCGYSKKRIRDDGRDSCLAWKDEDEPRTNADRIRSMTDEELADYFSELSCWPHAKREDCRGMANCMDCWLDWLKQEIKE